MIFIVLVVPMRTITYEPKSIFLCPISTFGLPSTIVDGLKVLDTPSLDGNLLSKSTTNYISDLVIRSVYILNGIAWHVAILRSLIVNIDRSIIKIRSFFAYMCSKPGSEDVSNALMLNALSPLFFLS